MGKHLLYRNTLSSSTFLHSNRSFDGETVPCLICKLSCQFKIQQIFPKYLVTTFLQCLQYEVSVQHDSCPRYRGTLCKSCLLILIPHFPWVLLHIKGIYDKIKSGVLLPLQTASFFITKMRKIQIIFISTRLQHHNWRIWKAKLHQNCWHFPFLLLPLTHHKLHL